jgi:hypothetical protein
MIKMCNVHIIHCERCGEVLKPETAVWLELSLTDANWYLPDKFPEGHKSQGGFSFGKTCAKKVLKNKI